MSLGGDPLPSLDSALHTFTVVISVVPCKSQRCGEGDILHVYSMPSHPPAVAISREWAAGLVCWHPEGQGPVLLPLEVADHRGQWEHDRGSGDQGSSRPRWPKMYFLGAMAGLGSRSLCWAVPATWGTSVQSHWSRQQEQSRA